MAVLGRWVDHGDLYMYYDSLSWTYMSADANEFV